MSVDRSASGKSVKIRTVRLLTRKHLVIDENQVDVLLCNLKCWGTLLLVKCSQNVMGLDTRNVKTRTMERCIVFRMQAHTTSTTNWHAMLSLYTKLDTGMILLKNNLKNTFFETLPPSCNEDVYFKYKFNGPHDPCEITNYTNKHYTMTSRFRVFYVH